MPGYRVTRYIGGRLSLSARGGEARPRGSPRLLRSVRRSISVKFSFFFFFSDIYTLNTLLVSSERLNGARNFRDRTIERVD